MSTVTSRDGTTIAYNRLGDGPPLILVDGALCHRGMGPMPALAKQLAGRFTVIVYDRRGRGGSGNTLPWSRDREIDDIAALITAAGGSASLVGVSSGAVLALDAAARGLPVPNVAVYEAPLIVDASRTPVPDDFIAGLERLVAQGNRNEVVKRFMRIVGAPAFVIALMRFFPNWPKLAAVAHTVPYDMTLLQGLQSGRPLPRDRWAALRSACLVLDGGKSPAWMRNGNKALADILPRSAYRTLPGQTHMVKVEVLAPALIDFLARPEPARMEAV
jgi:pimeloyl-ACP methyl ester carboxylesterase